jgi:hypothetical protein
MNLDNFIHKVSELVRDWNTDAETRRVTGDIPRGQLEAIYNAVRNGAAFDLATMQRERDEALAKMHAIYINQKPRKAGQ